MKKLLYILAAACLLSFTVRELKFSFTEQEANTILKALSKLPYEEAAPIIFKMQEQARKQLTDTTKSK